MNLSVAFGSHLPVTYREPVREVSQPKTRVRKPKAPLNPWRLTPAEQRCMEAVIATGRNRLAAEAVGIALRTLEVHLLNARRKMGGLPLLQACIELDRWGRVQA